MGKPLPQTAFKACLTGIHAVMFLCGVTLAVQAEPTAFSRQVVLDEAKRLSEDAFVPPAKVPDALLGLDYSEYRRINYRKKAAIWGGTPTRFSVEMFAPGNLYASGVDISVVENGKAFPAPVNETSFDTPRKEISALLAKVGQLAGFRLHYPLNREDYEDEFIVFQGASYFRAVSRGQTYGLSARGLAVDVAEPTGEEFPIFRKFWIERPSSHADSIVVHALLDSPRVSGAYRFGIYPDDPTRMDVEATLFPRAPLKHVGLGALTSMFYFGSIDRSDRPDYREAVYDSTGLAIHTGSGERLWRPLSNPNDLQVSAFMDKSPKGFGLILRDRRPEAFEDQEAGYHTRPSAWVVPRGDWGEGHVQLVEIPTPLETNDNIVAYWRPKAPLQPGMPYQFSYRLTWPNDNPLPAGFGRVRRSAYGLKLGTEYPQMVIDYRGMPKNVPIKEIKFDRSVSRGRIVEVVAQRVDEEHMRVFLTFEPGTAGPVEIRIQPKYQGAAVGETWLYRWTS
ncbi:glucan biosynthesis protein G [Kordiimonas aestuarii]|uniref:glucan biosynthesis protein G n=1 Tax=Kordiimonas aestuarii TaxID=1005925 RepID=UPI0021CEF2B9|nr:glucan biosynthesis protein G [Kordiimonas aestuarii]